MLLLMLLRAAPLPPRIRSSDWSRFSILALKALLLPAGASDDVPDETVPSAATMTVLVAIKSPAESKVSSKSTKLGGSSPLLVL
jgi:hypothetical protein